MREPCEIVTCTRPKELPLRVCRECSDSWKRWRESPAGSGVIGGSAWDKWKRERIVAVTEQPAIWGAWR